MPTFVSTALKNWAHKRRIRFFKRHTPKTVFSHIYRNRLWGQAESVSGTGSTLAQTAVLRAQLPALCKRYGIKTLLDIPCGDFNWMRAVDLGGIAYQGADVVGELIQTCRAHYATNDIQFEVMDLLEDPLPQVDLILCRDCMVHFSDRDVFKALENLRNSGSRYLLTTSFSGRASNTDIVTGQWRPLNLEIAPFHLVPIDRLYEQCTEGAGAFADKSLLLVVLNQS